MDTDLPAAARAALCAPSATPDTVVADLPASPALHAWWAAPDVLPTVGGGTHPGGGTRLLWVGAATMLRNRVTRQDLYRTGVSEFRRAVAGLLLDDLDLTPVHAADVVLPRADEDRLTDWMRAHLRLTWWVGDERRELLDGVVDALDPGLRADTDPGRAALARFVAAAGEKTVRVVGVPYRRP